MCRARHDCANNLALISLPDLSCKSKPGAVIARNSDHKMIEDPRTEQDLASVLGRRAAQIPDTPWIVTDDRSYTFHEIDRSSSRLASGFSGLDITAGDTVLVMLPDTVDFIRVW